MKCEERGIGDPETKIRRPFFVFVFGTHPLISKANLILFLSFPGCMKLGDISILSVLQLHHLQSESDDH